MLLMIDNYHSASGILSQSFASFRRNTAKIQ